MKKEKCKNCGTEIELRDDERIRICVGNGYDHIVEKINKDKKNGKKS